VNWFGMLLSSSLDCMGGVMFCGLSMCIATGRGPVEIDTSATSLVSSSNYAYASFPVDVVVYIRIQPSFIRFTCLPVSRVECLLRLPSVDVVFSSTKADLDSSSSDAFVVTGKSSGSLLVILFLAVTLCLRLHSSQEL